MSEQTKRIPVASVVEPVQSWPAPVPATGSGSGYRLPAPDNNIFVTQI